MSKFVFGFWYFEKNAAFDMLKIFDSFELRFLSLKENTKVGIIKPMKVKLSTNTNKGTLNV